MHITPNFNLCSDGSALLGAQEVNALRVALLGRAIALCFGAGVDSTAMLVALRAAGLRPDIITFADTGGEKPPTLTHIDRINELLSTWGWLPVTSCRKVPLATSLGISAARAAPGRPRSRFRTSGLRTWQRLRRGSWRKGR
jgi:hypothetical protein